MAVTVADTPFHQALVRDSSSAKDSIHLGHWSTGGDAQVCRRQVVFRARRICEQSINQSLYLFRNKTRQCRK